MNEANRMLCIPFESVKSMTRLFEIACNPAFSAVARKDEKGWVFQSTMRIFNDPSQEAYEFNILTDQAQRQGFHYIFIINKQ